LLLVRREAARRALLGVERVPRRPALEGALRGARLLLRALGPLRARAGAALPPRRAEADRARPAARGHGPAPEGSPSLSRTRAARPRVREGAAREPARPPRRPPGLRL